MNSTVNFNHFIDNNINISIPQIQRDYAEGRKLGKAPKVRKNLLGDILEVARGNKTKCELDFVYGYQKNGVFEPLDGQQRLTTLFLVYWFFIPKNKTLKVNSEPILTYQNRPTSNNFCQKLVEQKTCDLIQGYNNSTKKMPFGDYIAQLGFFRWDWKYDATIQSMLVVINDLYENTKNEVNDFGQFYINLQNITFNFLNLDDFKMGDELYIKMNARGKELSSFDLLKSYLEKDCSTLNQPTILRQWQTKIDGSWLEYFWNKYYDNSETNSVTIVETNFEQLLKILIFNQIIKNTDECTIKKGLNDELVELTEAKEIIDSCLEVYDNCNFTINYQTIIDQIDALYFFDGTSYCDFDTLLDTVFYNDSINNEGILKTLLTSYEYYKNVLLYAGIRWFQEICPIRNMGPDQKTNFNIFMRFIRNIYTTYNAGPIRINNKGQLKNAFDWIDNLILNYKSQQQQSFRHFIATFQIDYRGGQIEEISINEEATKAQLIENNINWLNYIYAIENNKFFLGQIHALLYSSDHDITKFNFITSGLNSLFENIEEEGYKLLQLMLILDEYYNSTKDNVLVVLSKDRDRSLKYHLRTKSTDLGFSFLQTFKSLMSIWYDNYNQYHSFDDFYQQYKNDNQTTISGFTAYRTFLITNDRWANTGYFMKDKQKIYIENDNSVYYRRYGNNKEELILAHIKGVVKKFNNKIFSLVNDDCSEDRITFTYNENNQANNGTYKIQHMMNNAYELEKNGVLQISNSSYDDIINYLNTNLKDEF